MPVKYIAEVQGGREVALNGTADFQYWKHVLAPQGLAPTQCNNQAEIVLSAVELKWMGVRFSELSVAICVHEANEPEKAGIYLAAAFNTSRMFSFIERRCFHTPYRHARVSVSTHAPSSFQLTDDANTILQAERHGTTAPEERDNAWQGAIYLPSRITRAQKRYEVFFARLSGRTQITPFEDSLDLIQFAVSKRDPIFQLLIDSRFTGVEWRVRSNATHARSKTYKRGCVP
jgi:hypothetical protein